MHIDLMPTSDSVFQSITLTFYAGGSPTGSDTGNTRCDRAYIKKLLIFL